MTTSPMHPAGRGQTILALLFFCSGFSSLIYQVVWLRMAFAHFGIVPQVLSVVISVFMFGLGIGSLLAGRWVVPLSMRLRLSPTVLYGGAELGIAAGAFAVPVLFAAGETALLGVGSASSGWYLLLSALIITGSILPWCVMMGATFPLMMAYVRARDASQRESFSYLYAANVIGAASGTLASALVLIELFGFARTSLIAAGVNGFIALVSFLLPKATAGAAPVAVPGATPAPGPEAVSRRRGEKWQLLVLFTTGFCSLAMEVVWTRAFTVVLHTTIYAFAAILATYLLATWHGSVRYREALRRGMPRTDTALLLAAAATALLPVVLNDMRVHVLVGAVLGFLPLPWPVITVLVSIAPFCAVLGYLTPKLVDDYAQGDPRRAGRCYAINVLGGILGPLVAGYLIIPALDTRYNLIIFALPVAVLAGVGVWRLPSAPVVRWRMLAPTLVLLGLSIGASRSHEEHIQANLPGILRRDHVATVIARGQDMRRQLLVNGVGITSLTPITKVMAHLPLAVQGQTRTGLVICFGMGTTFRSMAAWGIDATAVDLVPSVPEVFDYFHADAAQIVANPRNHIVVDDGRRFLMRTDKMFDVIVIDPPPPVEAAGSSLLYSTEFYSILKRRLNPAGILQQWMPDAEPKILDAALSALQAAFPYVVVVPSIEDWGHHILASIQPIPEITAAEFVARMPESARRDMVEWGPHETAEQMAAEILRRARPGGKGLSTSIGQAPPISDDRPFNEYFLLRRIWRN